VQLHHILEVYSIKDMCQVFFIILKTSPCHCKILENNKALLQDHSAPERSNLQLIKGKAAECYMTFSAFLAYIGTLNLVLQKDGFHGKNDWRDHIQAIADTYR
jgi:hypothetical protein